MKSEEYMGKANHALKATEQAETFDSTIQNRFEISKS